MAYDLSTDDHLIDDRLHKKLTGNLDLAKRFDGNLLEPYQRNKLFLHGNRLHETLFTREQGMSLHFTPRQRENIEQGCGHCGQTTC